MKKIFIIESFQDDNRNALWDNIDNTYNGDFEFIFLSTDESIINFIPLINNDDKIPFVLFAHLGDINRLLLKSDIINACSNRIIPLVLYSGSPDNYIINGLMIDKMHVSFIMENYVSFFDHLKFLTSISEEDLGRIIAIDPELEKLLKDFAAADPFKVNSTLKEAKASLQNHINILLTKPQ